LADGEAEMKFCNNCSLKNAGDRCVVCDYPFPRQGGQWVGFNGASYALWKIEQEKLK